MTRPRAPLARITSSCAALLLGITALNAQSQVVPATATNLDGNGIDARLVSQIASRTQLVIDRAQLGSMTNRAIRRIALRRDVQMNEALATGWRPGFIDLEVIASWTNARAASPSPVFAANHGSKRVTVYRGLFSVTASPKLPNGTKVATFAPNVSPNIVLQRPILPSSTGNLCLELVRRDATGRTSPQEWIVDVFEQPLPGSVTTFGLSCWHKTYRSPSASASEALAIGATLGLHTTGPKAGVALLFIGTSNTRLGLLPLPFDLTALGAPGCSIYVSNEMLVPVLMRSYAKYPQSEASFELPVPSLASLLGGTLYSQWMFVEPAANRLGLTMTNGVATRLASVRPTLGIGLIQATSATAASGRIWVDRSPVIRLSTQ